MFDPREKIAVLIDGANLYSASRALGFDIDYRRLLSDFRHLVEALQRKGKKVTVASTLRTQPPMIADDLRRQADHFLELSTLAETLGRDPSTRPPRPAPEPDDEDEDEFEEL